MTFSTAEVSQALSFMNSKIGHPYSENTSLRLGPTYYDCSGLVYEALHAAGIDIPRGDAIASSEANWLGQQSGVQVIKSANQVKEGDIVFFTGASPDPSTYGPIGHVGMATSSTQYVSAYDTQEGVVTKPLSGDGFVVAMRLSGGTPSPTGGGGGGGGILDIPQEITSFFSEADKFVTLLMWIAKPSSWLRIGAFIAGVGLLLFAVHALIAAANGEPLVKMPSVVPVPV